MPRATAGLKAVAALGAAAFGVSAFGAVEFIIYPWLSGVVGRRRARVHGCHVHEFPHSQQQALLAMCMLKGIEFPGDDNPGDKKEEKHSSHNDVASSNLKGKPMTKTTKLHWLQHVTNHVPTTDEAIIRLFPAF